MTNYRKTAGTVLLITRDRGSYTRYAQALIDRGALVIMARDTLQAMNYLSTIRFELIVMDEIKGAVVDFVREVQAKYPYTLISFYPPSSRPQALQTVAAGRTSDDPLYEAFCKLSMRLLDDM